MSTDRGFAFESFGIRLAVETECADFRSLLAARLPALLAVSFDSPCLRRYQVRRQPDGILTLRRGRGRRLALGTLAAAADLVAADAQRLIAQNAAGRVFVHAGVVAWCGHAILLPGRSGSGKSRLVAALVWAGADYFSDELAVLSTGGTVSPYARPLALRRHDGSFERILPGELPSGVGTSPLPVAVVAFVRYRAGARWNPCRLSPGASLLGLLRHTLAAPWRFALARELFLSIVTTSVALRSPRGQAEEAAAQLLEVVGAVAAERNELSSRPHRPAEQAP